MTQTGNDFEASAIRFGYDSKSLLLDNISLVVARNCATVLGGANGTGKSTLLKILARQLKPLSGEVKLGGADTRSMSPEEFARQVAYVPQSLELNTHLTVEELVMLGRNPHQQWWSWHASDKDKDTVLKALERTELNKLRSRAITTLSGGELKRAMIATALAQETPFILLDEPVAHLDFKHQLSLLSLIVELKNSGLGILIVLHDLNMIERVADHVVLLKKDENGLSRIALSGARDQILSDKNIEDVFEVKTNILKDESGRRFFALVGM